MLQFPYFSCGVVSGGADCDWLAQVWDRLVGGSAASEGLWGLRSVGAVGLVGLVS